MQKKLNKYQIENFQNFLGDESQVDNLLNMVPYHFFTADRVIVDVGGGNGFFYELLKNKINSKVVILDSDLNSIERCTEKGMTAYFDDVLNLEYKGRSDIVCFNLTLHHLIGENEELTYEMQCNALRVFAGKSIYLFIDEYSYDSFIFGLSGKLIYNITSNKFLSKIASIISIFFPSLKANTFGVGVRFREMNEWINLFEFSGYKVIKIIKGENIRIPFLRRLLFIRRQTKDSFLLIKKL